MDFLSRTFESIQKQVYFMKKQRRKLNLEGHLGDKEMLSFKEDRELVPPTFQSLQRYETNKIIGSKKDMAKTSRFIQSFNSLRFQIDSHNDEIKTCEQDTPLSPASMMSNTDRKNDDKTTQCLLELAKKSVKKGTNRKKSQFRLKQMISKQKVSNLRNKFIQKIKRNNAESPPVDYIGFDQEDKSSILQRQGFAVNLILDNVIGLLSIVQIVFLFVMYTLSLVFSDLESSILISILQQVSIVIYLTEIFYNLMTVKSQAGRRLITFEQILNYYYRTNLIIDILNMMILVIDISTKWYFMMYVRLFIVTKLPQCMEKMQKLQVSFIKNYHYEQYWSLIKVVLFNFCFAHILAIFLTAMANINPTENWYQLRGIQDAFWFEKYIWGYYWGVNIMLTVGFGDFYATTYQEALCLIFIEIISVMCLAYNINWVGTLISNIRAQDIERCKNFKTFKQLSEKYGLPAQLEWRISNYIEESVNIRKKFNIEEEHSFIGSLPQTMKKEYLKESNKSIFHSLPFFSSLVDKTLYNFAQKIEMTISHPQQILRRIDDDYNLLILREGEIGYTVKRRNCNFNDLVVDKVKVRQNDRPFILGLEFLTRERPIYQTKSLEYSVIYSLSYDDLISILRDSHMDYLHFCFLRDKNRSTPDQFEILACEFCNGKEKHTKFTCPKLHYIPLHQVAVYKEHHREKTGKNKRIQTQEWRIQLKKSNALISNKRMLYLLEDIPRINGDKPNMQSNKKKNVKIGNDFLDKVAMMKKLKESYMEESKQENIEEWFMKSTSELIKQEFDRYFRNESYEDEVWTINCDKMKSYKEYFPESNACNLEYSFNVDERLINMQKVKREAERNIKIGSFACYLNGDTEFYDLDSV